MTTPLTSQAESPPPLERRERREQMGRVEGLARWGGEEKGGVEGPETKCVQI